MGCCKCEIYGWDEPQKVVWTNTEGDGKEYCVYHAPKDHKNISTEEFNELVFARIDAHKVKHYANKPCPLDGVVFPGTISFEKYNQLPSISLDESTFSGEACFNGITFIGVASLNEVSFDKLTRFVGATFDKGANFTYCTFYKKTSFSGATFGNNTLFSWASFNDEAIFDGSTFAEGASLFQTKFSKAAHFSYATFGDNVSFFETIFKGPANFEGVKFKGTSEFVDVNFFSMSNFYNASFDGISQFVDCHIEQQLTFRELSNIKDLRFFGMDMCSTDFLHTSLTNIRFQNVIWKKNQDEARYCLSIEDNTDPVGMEKDDPLLDNAARYVALAEFYRQMKKRNRDEQNDAEASLWHYAEKEVQLKFHRLEKPLSFQRFMLEIYRAISRYGEDPLQAFNILIALIIFLFCVLSLTAFHERSGPQVEITMLQVNNLFRLFGQYCLFDKIEGWRPPGIVDFCVLFLSRLLIPIQAAIFAFALRNKLHR